MGVYNTRLYFHPFYNSQESELTILIPFFLLNTDIKAIFPITSSFPETSCQKSKRDHKYRYISLAIYLCLVKFFSNF